MRYVSGSQPHLLVCSHVKAKGGYHPWLVHVVQLACSSLCSHSFPCCWLSFLHLSLRPVWGPDHRAYFCRVPHMLRKLCIPLLWDTGLLSTPFHRQAVIHGTS